MNRNDAPTGVGAALPVIIVGIIGLLFGIGFAVSGFMPVDARVYFDADPAGLYASGVLGEPLYLYPPPLAQLLVPLHNLGWPVFVVAWMTLVFIGLGIAGRWFAVAAVVGGLVALPVLGMDHFLEAPLTASLIGNAQPLLVAAIVLGFRWPAAWAFVILTKILPGVGVIWFAARGEWRNLAIAIGATVLVTAVSFALAPQAWVEFVGFALGNADMGSRLALVPVPLAVRLPVAIVLLIWGARTNRRWTVPIACGMASFALYQWSFATVWLAALALVDWSGHLQLNLHAHRPRRSRAARDAGPVARPTGSTGPA